METFLQSEIERLIYGYLNEIDCEEAAEELLNESPYLQECVQLRNQNRSFSTNINGRSLLQILDHYMIISSEIKKKAKAITGADYSDVKTALNIVLEHEKEKLASGSLAKVNGDEPKVRDSGETPGKFKSPANTRNRDQSTITDYSPSFLKVIDVGVQCAFESTFKGASEASSGDVETYHMNNLTLESPKKNDLTPNQRNAYSRNSLTPNTPPSKRRKLPTSPYKNLSPGKVYSEKGVLCLAEVMRTDLMNSSQLPERIATAINTAFSHETQNAQDERVRTPEHAISEVVSQTVQYDPEILDLLEQLSGQVTDQAIQAGEDSNDGLPEWSVSNIVENQTVTDNGTTPSQVITPEPRDDIRTFFHTVQPDQNSPIKLNVNNPPPTTLIVDQSQVIQGVSLASNCLRTSATMSEIMEMAKSWNTGERKYVNILPKTDATPPQFYFWPKSDATPQQEKPTRAVRKRKPKK